MRTPLPRSLADSLPVPEGAALAHSQACAEMLRAEINKAGGWLSFARFMELALYCPDYGFYEKESDTLGRHGHFQTSVNVGNLFGHLLAIQFALWTEQFKIKLSDFKTPSAMVSLQIVEAGAHDGKLAADVMGWFQSQRPELFAALQYFIVEPSCRRRKWQAVTLSPFGEG